MGRLKSVPKRSEVKEDEFLGLLAHDIEDVSVERPRVDEEVRVRSDIDSTDRQRDRRKKPRKLTFADDVKGGEEEPTRNFAEDLVVEEEVAVETTPELEIVVETPNDDNDNEQQSADVPTTVLYYHHTPSAISNHEEGKTNTNTKTAVRSSFLLHTIVLDPSVRLKAASTNSEPPQLPFQITTYKGALTLLEFCQNLQQPYNNRLTKTENVAKAVERGLLELSMCTTKHDSHMVVLSLSDWAFEMCNPSKIHHKARRNSTLCQMAFVLRQALVDLVSTEKDAAARLIAPQQAAKSTSQIITAKQVYSLVDNVQYKAFLDKKLSATGALDIPGLRPTLRPYQEAAVRWMIERENNGTSGGDEWELAWTLIVVETTRTGDGSHLLVSNRKVLLLPELSIKDRERLETEKMRRCYYFCPLTGWLASSYNEARRMTLDGTEVSSTNNHFVTGGILAESMGLGKSVEVLALVMANQDPRCRIKASASTSTASSLSSQQAASTIQAETGSQLKTIFQLIGDEKVQTDLNSNKPMSSRTPGSPAAVSDIDNLPFVVAPENLSDEFNNVSDSEGNTSIHERDDNNAGYQGTPTIIEERWVEGSGCELGSCICGRSISILSCPTPNSVIICAQCREPMHMDCAVFGAEKHMFNTLSEIIVFKRRFSHETFSCPVCPQSLCPCCVADDSKARSRSTQVNNKIRSGATVIVTPPAILTQWEGEINRHVRTTVAASNLAELNVGADIQRPLKVAVYPGIRELLRQQQERKGGAKDFNLAHPRWLASADIVLMTFDALHQDLGHSDSNPYVAGATGKSLRKRKRYRVVPSPLSSIHWWRVCLDEAQRVETPTTGSAQMALKLDAKHRWAVSGTPIGRGKLDDLFGLLLFLKVAPFSDNTWFRLGFGSGSIDGVVGDRIKHLLRNVFWRSTKSWDVIKSQMGVPDQIEKKKYLKFSSVEKHFYDRQLEETLNLAGEITEHTKKRKRGGGNSNLDVLANQLHKLRAACCHPQVGSSGIGKTRKAPVSNGVSSKVLSMEQILDRLIDDTQTKCEEALRVALFHSNPMATITRLKVEAKNHHNVDVTESDEFLLSQSCKLYQDALDLADEHATPCLTAGEAILTGSPGFRSPHKRIREAKAVIDWQLREKPDVPNETRMPRVWANFAFEGQPKKLKQIRARTIATIPVELQLECSGDFSWDLLYPKTCVLQVSSTALGGEFVDVAKFSLPKPHPHSRDDERWITQSGLWLHKSKIWRMVVDTYHDEPEVASEKVITSFSARRRYIGLEVEIHEPTIASDPLQRLHTLHNACISLREFLASRKNAEGKGRNERLPVQRIPQQPSPMSVTDIQQKIDFFQQDCIKIESHVLHEWRNIHAESRRRLNSLVDSRQKLASELSRLSGLKDTDFYDDIWFEDIVAYVNLHGSAQEQTSLLEKTKEVIGSYDFDTRTSKSPAFPAFDNIRGLLVGLKFRFAKVRAEIGHGQYSKIIRCTLDLPSDPTRKEILENQHCVVCKADWYRTGPKCQHCILGDKLTLLNPDKFSGMSLDISLRSLLKAILTWAKGHRTGVRGSNPMKTLVARGTKYFEVLEASRKEVLGASSFWIAHADLLNILDEIESCKRPMRLLQYDEDMSTFTEEEKGAVVVPVDVMSRYHEHAAKQAMALSNLRRQKLTLQFLKNQSSEQGKDTCQQAETKESCETCPVCLSAFDNDRAVLTCGHSFHLSPCLDKLKKRSGAGGFISCPLRCTIRTDVKDVMVATTKRNDDGSQSKRNVRGSWGTKVTAITADLLSVSDLGEKSILFSMWEDMLDIIEEALTTNGINSVRATSSAQIGDATKKFHSPDCAVLLLNVKNGAEGLTLIEATHVFMVEPMLNYGLDSQARARCHRIGQTRQTYLHRYLIEDTIEIKIDKIRMQHQEDQLEDAMVNTRKCTIKAGGIDGGFSSQEELMDILKL